MATGNQRLCETTALKIKKNYNTITNSQKNCIKNDNSKLKPIKISKNAKSINVIINKHKMLNNCTKVYIIIQITSIAQQYHGNIFLN